MLLSGIFELSNKARDTPRLVSFRGLIQSFRRPSLTFSHKSYPWGKEGGVGRGFGEQVKHLLEVHKGKFSAIVLL